MKIQAYIFDQDGTLYPKNHVLTFILRNKTKDWIKNSLSLSQEEVDKLYLELPNKHPHPYLGFESLGLSAKDYLTNIFDKIDPSTYLQKDAQLRSLLKSMPGPKFVATLSSISYSKKLQKALGIDAEIIKTYSTIDEQAPYSKKQIYQKIMTNLNLPPSTILVIGDNYKIDIEPATEIGMQHIHLNNNNITNILKRL
ncbi:MAG: HAD family hydrolase [Candidatus Nanoarchaeia archaeon]